MKTSFRILAAALPALAFASCGPSDAKLKEEFNKGCMQQSASVGTDPAMQQAYKDFCDCSGDKIIKGLSRDELEQMGKGENQAAIMAKATPLIQACTDELTRKMGASMGQ